MPGNENQEVNYEVVNTYFGLYRLTELTSDEAGSARGKSGQCLVDKTYWGR